MRAVSGFARDRRLLPARLRTDHIDIYQVHWPDPAVAIEETAEAMHTLFRQGRSAPSASATFRSARWRNSAALLRCMCCNRPIICSSARLTVISCPIAAQIRSRCSDMARSAGSASGRMRPNTTFDGDDLRRTDPKFRHPRFAQYLAAVQRLDQWRGTVSTNTLFTWPIRRTLDQGITTALWGARHPGQLEPVDRWRAGGWMRGKVRDRSDPARVRERSVGPEFMAPAGGHGTAQRAEVGG